MNQSLALKQTRGWLGLLMVLLIGMTATLFADVKDDGEFFKPETVEKANSEIKQIKADYGKELVVETFGGVPEAWKDEYNASKDDAKKRSEFFGKWIGERAHQLQVNGVYILICKDPGHLEVKAGQKTKQKAFTEINQNKLRDILLEEFKAKNDDEGLTKGVEYFRTALKENVGTSHAPNAGTAGDEQFKHPNSGASSGSPFPNRTQKTNYPTPPAAAPASSSFRWSSIMTVILIVIAAIVIIRVLASMTGGNRSSGPGYGPGPQSGPGYGAGYGGGGYGNNYAGGGGGGFFRNMFGGLLGGAAGSYLYDRYRDSNNPGHNPQNPNTGGFSGNTPDTSSGGDFNSPTSSSDDNDRGQGFGGGGSGGDFGASGSDADSGFSSSDSGGSSGGDFGSSDSGSSGGDSGGASSGGGDF